MGCTRGALALRKQAVLGAAAGGMTCGLAGAVQVCAEVRPKLPAGYCWADAGWAVDMEGAANEGVDEDGWTYGVHWKWLTQPPTAGTGKKKFGYHFVRRRRWVLATLLHLFAFAQRASAMRVVTIPALIQWYQGDGLSHERKREVLASRATHPKRGGLASLEEP